MIQSTMTAGALRLPKDFTHVDTMRPPAPTLEDLDAMIPPKVSRAPVVLIPRSLPAIYPPAPTAQRMVAHAIVVADGLDLSLDHPYMPFEGGTTLREAHNFLRLNRYVLIQGGRIDHIMGGYRLTMWDKGPWVAVDQDDVREVLELNYPDPDAVEIEVEVRDTDPCSPLKPLPAHGVGLYADVVYGTDIDLISDEEWKPIAFPPTIAQGAVYIGELTLNEQLWDAWWHMTLSCYLAQQVPAEELPSRRTPMPASL